MRLATCLLVLTLMACSTVPTPSGLPRGTATAAPTIAPAPTPLPSPSPLAGKFVGPFGWSGCSMVLVTREGRGDYVGIDLDLHRRYDIDRQLGRLVIVDRDGTVVAGEGDRIGVDGVIGQLGGGWCALPQRVIRHAVIVDVDPAAPFTLRDPEPGIRYPLQIQTNCGLEPVGFVYGGASRYWDFEGPTGESAPDGFGDPSDVGIIYFHDAAHANFISSGRVRIGLRRFSWNEPDPSIPPCPM
jgi:hypothetical protein